MAVLSGCEVKSQLSVMSLHFVNGFWELSIDIYLHTLAALPLG
jgi:hypothetical protein